VLHLGFILKAFKIKYYKNGWRTSMLTVSEVSKLVKTTPDTIRHYVRIGLVTPSRHPENGYRQFSDNEIKKVKFIIRAKSLGFTLHDIQIMFDHTDKGQSPCPKVRDIIKKRIDENRVRLTELNMLQGRMDAALEKWQTMPNGEPDGDELCHLIESIN